MNLKTIKQKMDLKSKNKNNLIISITNLKLILDEFKKHKVKYKKKA